MPAALALKHPERVEHLFALYEQLTAPLAPSAKPVKRRKASPKPSDSV